MAEEIMIPGIESDGSFYPIEKMEAHRRGVLHLAISVFVFSGDHLLIQRRADGKYHCGGLWANTCCTHPHWGESPVDGAPRRLQEELGFTVSLREVGVVEYRADVGKRLVEHERVHMFHGEVDRDALTFTPNPEEVSDTRWTTRNELMLEVARTPEIFTPWFRIYLDRQEVFAA